MPINVSSVPTLPDHVNDVRLRTAELVNAEILPREGVLWPQRSGAEVTASQRDEARTAREDVKAKVRAAGLWAPHLPTEYGGMGLDFLSHAYMNEILAYAMGAASLFGVVAPNSGNQRILVKYGTEPGFCTWPMTETLRLFHSLTMTDTCGFLR